MDIKDFCLRVGQKLGLTRDHTHKVFSTALSELRELLREGDELRVPFLGRFYSVVREAREHIDRFALARGETITYQLDAKRVVRFAPFKTTIDYLNLSDPEAEATQWAPAPEVDLDESLSQALAEGVPLHRDGQRLTGLYSVVKIGDGERVVFLREGSNSMFPVEVACLGEGLCDAQDGTVFTW